MHVWHESGKEVDLFSLPFSPLPSTPNPYPQRQDSSGEERCLSDGQQEDPAIEEGVECLHPVVMKDNCCVHTLPPSLFIKTPIVTLSGHKGP